MNEEEREWLMREFRLTAERAKEKGIPPHVFLMGLQAYGRKMLEDYREVVDDGK